jgi:hypothetical protein
MTPPPRCRQAPACPTASKRALPQSLTRDTGTTSTNESQAAFKAYLVQKTIALGGRQIVAVVHFAGYTEANTYMTGYYLPLQPGKNYPTAAEAVAVATRYAESVGAASHPVVVFDFPL